MKFTPSRLAVLAAATAALLVACGGSGGDDATPPAEDTTQVPSSVTASVQNWFKFAAALMPMDDSTALAMDNVTSVPQTDSDEPQTLPTP